MRRARKKRVQNHNHGSATPCERDFCNCTAPRTTFTTATGKTLTAVHDKCREWMQAQCFCCRYFGEGAKLWEPDSQGEYDEVAMRVQAAVGTVTGECGRWTGLVNFADKDDAKMLRYDKT